MRHRTRTQPQPETKTQAHRVITMAELRCATGGLASTERAAARYALRQTDGAPTAPYTVRRLHGLVVFGL
jgi:hypothetical protein